jgi:queuine tRNA-ribosyltransferase
MLLTRHNLTYYQDLMASLRSAIEAGRLAAFATEFERRNAEDSTAEDAEDSQSAQS